ncbi:lytic transglycosylase domain-containing protein [Roseomonas indoligenes]|uniref:Lytic transglycosylase domain-containing protein n=1 Tax=Roseomonas indoligenes TaxID=2820811 RepID=A0A940N273_9PROT|nr:lytic transglycosylase domain-containing protein [Pararoseomonas indoligenes]MBP0494686.1 lytic transglycosylase domain-containing protein [Pararoseomonas indoligenes]
MNLIARGANAPSPQAAPALRRGARAVAAMSVLAALAACGNQPEASGPVTSARSTSTSRIASYDPPGPPSDPWGPYIREASNRFDVPERWIREVMRQESGGRLTATSRVGAMGLLQLMPGTYAELNAKHGFGDDPYHPWANLMAGTAYIREMYDLYGSPGFLAAYNGGPKRLENYLWAGGRMPDETRNYVARIGPRLSGEPRRRAPEEVYAAADIGFNPPSRRSSGADPATMLAIREQRRNAAADVQVARLAPGTVTRMEPIPDGSTYASSPAAAPVQTQLASLGPNVIRMEPIPDGSTYTQPERVVVAQMDPIPDGSTYQREPAPVVVARMDPIPDPPAPSPSAAPRAMAVASAEAAPANMPFERATPTSRFSIVPSAQAGTLPAPMTRQNGLPPGLMRAGTVMPVAPSAAAASGSWGIQVGAFASENLARDAAGQARNGAGNGRATVMAVAQGRSTLYRARVTGLSRDAAQSACDRLRSRGNCMIVSPES